MKQAPIGLYFIISIVVIGFFFIWMNSHDEAQLEAYNAYDACVEAQYHQTAVAYYQQNHKAAECTK